MNFRGAPFIKEFKIQLDLVYTTLSWHFLHSGPDCFAYLRFMLNTSPNSNMFFLHIGEACFELRLISAVSM
ncbi:hypothetical protein glysoja_039378 [Glycine soja]|uniref:Uncharacterized protein n=1 Tax=Glycine soja TaxID=3848 RepID=A0A0B2PWH1_GLYSO|nr:hypothetical protein glysoja_039378 [Glycine soja]